MNRKRHATGLRLSRRDMLKLLGAVGAVLVSPGGKSQTRPKQLKRVIPSSGESIPAMGLGTSDTFDVGPLSAHRKQVKEVLRLFAEQGGSMVDSSPMYGRAEEVVGDLSVELGVQDSLFLATKVWTEGRDAGIRQMERSKRLLRTNRIDLMQVHNLVDTRTHLQTLDAWKAQQRIRYVGVTHYRVDMHEALERTIKAHPLDFVQFNFSVVTRNAERRLLPLCAERGVAVIVNRAFEDGTLFELVHDKKLPAWAGEFDCHSWAQFFLKFVLSHPAVTTVIPATRKPRHLLDNMQAGLGRLPERKTREKMVAYMREI
jgi:aryl-alcohol dehydrogenase-like predicted oxidoreductase